MLQIVLDLDETLVCAYETSSLPAAIRTRAIEAGLIWFELECVSSEKVCPFLSLSLSLALTSLSLSLSSVKI